MKRYVSVFEMIIRSSIYKVLDVFALMAAVEVIMLTIAWNQPVATLQPTLEEWIERSWICIPFLAAYWLLTKVLASSGTNVGSMQGYTLQRLRIPEKKVQLLQVIYNMFCYALLWMMQVLILLVAVDFYMKHKTGVLLTNQTVFLAFYRNAFMHSILPLEDIFGWFILGFYIVMTGVLAASFTRNQRKGKVTWSLVIFVALAVVCFQRKLGVEPILPLMLMLLWIMYMLAQALINKGVQEDEREN
ncbi:MAG: hypothetical protein IJO60_06880 [Agathobacter sp.]|nr:hypothetical protein [Agathobacter sp.]